MKRNYKAYKALQHILRGLKLKELHSKDNKHSDIDYKGKSSYNKDNGTIGSNPYMD